MNGWFQRRCAHANCGFQAGKGSQPSNKKQREIPPKKQAGSYIVEYLFKLDDVIHMLLLEKHISFGVSICFTNLANFGKISPLGRSTSRSPRRLFSYGPMDDGS